MKNVLCRLTQFFVLFVLGLTVTMIDLIEFVILICCQCIAESHGIQAVQSLPLARKAFKNYLKVVLPVRFHQGGLE